MRISILTGTSTIHTTWHLARFCIIDQNNAAAVSSFVGAK
jgi:hypothetical protein